MQNTLPADTEAMLTRQISDMQSQQLQLRRDMEMQHSAVGVQARNG